MGHPQVQQYLSRARANCKAKGKYFMDIVHGKTDAEKRVNEGARLLILHDDVSLIYQWLKAQLQQIQEGASILQSAQRSEV
jgi:2-keto-3-deoxy-L-rhamnonate aldolase RhmA